MEQQKIGKFIYDLRKEKGLTQKQLADLVGVSDKTISKLGKQNQRNEGSFLTILVITGNLCRDQVYI